MKTIPTSENAPSQATTSLVLSEEETRALIARTAWRLFPIAAEPNAATAAGQVLPCFELIAAAVDVDRDVEVSALISDLPDNNDWAMAIRLLADPAQHERQIQRIRTIIEQTAEPWGGLALHALDEDLAFLESLGDTEARTGAIHVLERPLWSDLRAGAWTMRADALKDALEEAGAAPLAGYIDAIVQGGERAWAPLWRYLRIQRSAQQAGDVPLWMLSDEPVSSATDDLFGFADYASAISAFITDPRTGTPLTLAINGPWGCGKSSLARLIHRNLAHTFAEGQRGPHITCWFNAWMHDDAKDMAAAFASAVAQAADAHRSRWSRFIAPVPTELLTGSRHTKRKVIRWSFALFAVACVAVFMQKYFVPGVSIIELTRTPEALGTFLFGFGTLLLQVMQKITESAKTVNAFVNDPNAVAQRGSINQVRKQLDGLIKSATHGGRRFIIFVDDVERCRPPRAVDLLEVVNQLLSHEGVVTIVLADLPAVAAAAEIKYQDLVKVYAAQATANGRPTAAQSYGRLYLQKIIQLEFDVPAHRRESIREFVTGVGREKIGGDAATIEARQQAIPDRARAWIKALWRDGRRTLRATSKELGYWLIRHIAWVIGVLIVFGLLILVPVERVTLESTSLLVVGISFALGVFGTVLQEMQERINERIDSAEADRLRNLIDTKIGQGVQSPRVLKQAVSALRRGADDREIEQLINERLIRKITATDSDVWKAAVEEATRWVPPFPRHAKRLVNRMRLLLGIVLNRGGFADDPVGGARAVGKWVVLWERWPELAQQALRDPEWIAELETAANKEQRDLFDAAVATAAAQYKGDEDLLAFFVAAPKLSALIDRIVHLGHGG